MNLNNGNNNKNATRNESPMDFQELSNAIDSSNTQLNTKQKIEDNANWSKISEINKTQDTSSCMLEIAIKISEDNIQTLKVKDLIKPSRDVYDFCIKNSLDYLTMETIQSQVNTLIKESITAPKTQIKCDNIVNNSHSNPNTQRRPMTSKCKYSKQELDFNQKSYSMTGSHRSIPNTVKRAHSQRDSVTLFPYQIGITSYRIEKIRHKHNKDKKSKNKNRSSVNKNNISDSSSYKRSFQGRYATSPLAHEDNNNNTNGFNPTVFIGTDNNNQQYQTSQASQNQLKTAKELMNDQIGKDSANNFYLISQPNATKSKTQGMKETINNKSSLLDRKVNYGILLYERGLSRNCKLNRKISSLRQEMNKKGDVNNTFQPIINPISKQAQENRIAKGLEYNNPKAVSNYKSYSLEKTKALIEKYNYIEIEENENQKKFVPEINRHYKSKKKNKTDYNNNEYPNRFEKLYNDMKIRDKNLQELTDSVFKLHHYFPKVNKNAQIKMRFDYRLVENDSKMALKKDELTKKIKDSELYDNKTNQPLFQPKFESKSTRELRTMTHDTSIKKQKKKNTIKQEMKKSLNCTSEEIFETKKALAFKKIFKVLDLDDDGEISSITMNKKGLSKTMSKILMPLIDEMKECSETITEKEFIGICNKLYQVSFMLCNEIYYCCRYCLMIKGSN